MTKHMFEKKSYAHTLSEGEFTAAIWDLLSRTPMGKRAGPLPKIGRLVRRLTEEVMKQ